MHDKQTKKKIRQRKIIQGIFAGIWLLLIFVAIPRFIHTMHQHCPYALVCFGPLNLSGMNVYLPITILSLLIIFISIFIGRKFCGYICFLGTLQEYLFNIRSRKKCPIIKQKWHKLLSGLKYLVLLSTILLAFFSLQYYYMQFCPLENLAFPKTIPLSGVILLIIIFGFGFFIPRFWCRYLCPYAALMNIFLYLGKFLGIKRKTIVRDPDNCVNCNLCENNCPMGIKLSDLATIDDVNCIYCYRCVEVSPSKKDCLNC